MANEIKAGVRKFSQSVGGRKGPATTGFTKAGVSIGKAAKSYKDLLSMSPEQISKLNTGELRSVVARLNKVESKRLKNLEKYGYNTQAMQAIENAGGKTSASRQLTRNELMHEYKRAKAFLQSETSTVAGSKKFISGIQDMVGADRELTSDEISRLYDVLHKYEESGAIGYYEKGNTKSAGYVRSTETQKQIWDMMQSGKSDDEILVELGVMSRTEYEAGQDTTEDFTLFTGGTPWD